MNTPAGLPEGVLLPEDFRSSLPSRPVNAHKGVFGKLLLIGGSCYYPGAVCLAARAALRSGVGIATVAAPRSVCQGLWAALPGATWLPLPENEEGTLCEGSLPLLKEKLSGYSGFCIGCGLANTPDTRAFVSRLLRLAGLEGRPVVLDADGLNCTSADPTLLSECRATLILTPHKMEAARLMGCSLDEVTDSGARAFADRMGLTLVLKGEATLVLRRDGENRRLTDSMNPGMAKGGSGDVLAGILSSLTAQGMPADEAAEAAVWIHSRAGFAALEQFGTVSMLPSDLPEKIPDVFLQLSRG